MTARCCCCFVCQPRRQGEAHVCDVIVVASFRRALHAMATLAFFETQMYVCLCCSTYGKVDEIFK
jgi:hypothetical protein